MAASTGLPPTAAAAALAALDVLDAQPRRVERLAGNADALRTELAREGLGVSAADTHIATLPVEDARRAGRSSRRRSRRASTSRRLPAGGAPMAKRGSASP